MLQNYKYNKFIETKDVHQNRSPLEDSFPRPINELQSEDKENFPYLY